ncbi:MAG: hypothetical protein H6810_01365 [Phycisphaeraceae bacterium]|nr:MAG: hypothetical protein H6810_01365 [Phycisphaeraceae bacterium]
MPIARGRWTRRLVPWLVLALPLSGCQVVGLIGAMAESAHKEGSTTYPADYEGLSGHSYAVVVSADRLIEADNPGISTRLTQVVDRNIHDNAGATAHVPPGRLLSFLYANPQWQALPRGELGEQLGVERLVVIELVEYRLHEPGNRYTWDGVASGVVQVYEIGSAMPDDPMYEKTIAVGFPDQSGMLAEEIPETVVTSELSRRFGERAGWLFYTHEEKNDLKY